MTPLEKFARRFLDPEDLGYSVSPCVRDDARVALGMKPVEGRMAPAQAPSMNIDGVQYVEAPEASRCKGCVFTPAASIECQRASIKGFAVFGGTCGYRRTIYIPATPEAKTATAPKPVAEDRPCGWLYGNSYWESSNPRITDHIKAHGKPLFSTPPERKPLSDSRPRCSTRGWLGGGMCSQFVVGGLCGFDGPCFRKATDEGNGNG